MKPNLIMLYLSLFLVSLLVFAFCRFPAKESATHLSAVLTQKYSPVQIDIQNVDPKFPLGFKLKNFAIIFDKQTRVETNSLMITVNPASAFRKEKKATFESDFYQGILSGSMELKGLKPVLLSQIELMISGIKINDFRYQTDLADITLNLEISGEYSGSEVMEKDSGKGSLHMQNVSAAMKDSLFNAIKIPLVNFSNIRLEFIQTNNKVTVISCLAKGPIINVKLTGDIEFSLPLETSRLHLKGFILPDSIYLDRVATATNPRGVGKNSGREGIQFNVAGTLEKPYITL